MHEKRHTCRVCGHDGTQRFLSLGPTALANSFSRAAADGAPEPTFPLDVAFCPECALVQLEDVIDPAVLFRNYIYVTGTSDTMHEHNRRYAQLVTELLRMTPDDLVVEVASNDGSLLRHFAGLGARTLGIEPAQNIAAMARQRGIDTIDEFFDRHIAARVRQSHGAAAAVIANNVLAHVDHPVEMLRAAKSLLAPGGLVIGEFHDLGALLERLEYDTIYHEHLSYYSVHAIARACEEAGLRLSRVDRIPVHGGSLRIYAAAVEEQADHAEGPLHLLAEERERGLTALPRLRQLAADVERHGRALADLLRQLAASGHRLAAYGAPAKACTLLAHCGIGADVIPYTVDKNPMKVGTTLPGSHVAVREVETLTREQPDYVLLLSWNLAEEILGQQSAYRERGGKFVLPFPEPEIV